MNLRQLNYFTRVVEARNMTTAADLLNVAQPALGAQIKQLEAELGVELFIRHSRGVTTTAAGVLLYQHAKGIIGNFERAAEEVRKLGSAQRPQLRLGVSSSVVRVIGPELIIGLQRQVAEDVAVTIREERTHALLDALVQDQVDIAFVNNVEKMPGLERRAVMEEDLLLLTAPNRTSPDAEDSISFSEALEHELAITGRRGVLRRIVEGEAERLSMKVKVAYELYSIAAMKALVLRGDAATIAPYSLVAEEIREGVLKGRRIVRPALTRTVFIVRRTPADTAAYAGIDQYIESMINVYLQSVHPWARRL